MTLETFTFNRSFFMNVPQMYRLAKREFEMGFKDLSYNMLKDSFKLSSAQMRHLMLSSDVQIDDVNETLTVELPNE